MTIKIQDFIDSNKSLPSFLKKNKVLLSFDKVDKVFPKLGLPNCKEDIVLDNAPFVKASAINFINVFSFLLEDPDRMLNNYQAYFPDRKLTPEKQIEVRYWGFVIRNLQQQLYPYRDREQLIQNNNGKLSLKLAIDVPDAAGRVIFKANESLFRIYNKVYNTLVSLKCGVKLEKLDTMPEFKRFSSDNLPNDRFQIVFSSGGMDGLWDIATMSMRGITSCQSWDGQYKNNLVGSIVDPFVGMIYITSGTKMNDLGPKMVKRSVVRLAVNSATKKPFFVLDRMYPEYDTEIHAKFAEFIKNRTANKFDVVYGPTIDYVVYQNSYIPSSKVHEKLTAATQSYRDTKIPLKSEMQIKASRKEKNLQAKRTKFRNILRNTSYKTICYMNKDIHFANERVKNTANFILNSPDFRHLIKDYYRDIADEILESGPMDDEVLSSKEYMRRLCFGYIKNRDAQTKKLKRAFVKKVNKYFFGVIGDADHAKINSKIMSKILEPIQIGIDKSIKEELKTLLDKNPSISKLPN